MHYSDNVAFSFVTGTVTTIHKYLYYHLPTNRVQNRACIPTTQQGPCDEFYQIYLAHVAGTIETASMHQIFSDM